MNEEIVATKKGRKPKNPALNALANKLEHLEFVNPLTADEWDKVKALHNQPLKNISVLPYASGGPLWCVRASCLGMPVYLGMAHGGSLEHRAKMLRYADMCRVKFWPYRMRVRRAPKPGELNFSIERAEQDLKNEPAMVELLNSIEKYLLDNGVIRSQEEITAEIKATQKGRVQQTRQYLKDLNSKLDRVETELAETKTKLNQVIQVLDTRLDGLLGVVRSLQADSGAIMTTLLNMNKKVVSPLQGGVYPVSSETDFLK